MRESRPGTEGSSSPATERDASSTPATPSSGSSPPACPAATVSLSTSWRHGEGARRAVSRKPRPLAQRRGRGLHASWNPVAGQRGLLDREELHLEDQGC